MKPTKLPIQPAMCATCPFRPGVAEKYAALAPMIAASAMTEATTICHTSEKGTVCRILCPSESP